MNPITCNDAGAGLVSAEMTVSEALQLFPETLAIFHAVGVDSCCGGGHRIDIAAVRHGLNLRVLLAALDEAARAPRGRR